MSAPDKKILINVISVDASGELCFSEEVLYIRADLVPEVRWKWMVKNGVTYAAKECVGYGTTRWEKDARDFGSKEAALDFVRKNWGRVVKRKVR